MYQIVREYYTASTPTCLFPLQQEEGVKMWGRGFPGAAAYGAYGVYTNAARFGGFGGAFGAYNYTGSALAGELGPAAGINNALAAANAWPPPLPPGTGYGGPGLGGPGSAHTGSYGSGAPQVAPLRSLGTKIFVGRLPLEATAEDLRRYFNNFGRISDVYVPKDAKKTSHRGFGFVTFADEGAAERVALRTHEILGHQVRDFRCIYLLICNYTELILHTWTIVSLQLSSFDD
jgi:RNA-binding protein Musashi